MRISSLLVWSPSSSLGTTAVQAPACVALGSWSFNHRVPKLELGDQQTPTRSSRPSRCASHSQHGFTLVEMLVVLILVGLITSILFQALNQVFHLQSHVGTEMGTIRQQAMLSDWIRQVIEGVQPDYDNGKNKFRATERRIQALTTNPLTSAQGAIIPFTLELQFDNRRGETLLRYGEGADAPVLMAWAGDNGKFVFLDSDNVEFDTWPPPMAKKPAQLPTAVRLEGRRDGKPWILIAAPIGPYLPRPRLRDLIGNFAR